MNVWPDRSSAFGLSRLLLPGGQSDAVFFTPVAHNLLKRLAAESIPLVPHIVGCYLVFEAAKRVIAPDCSHEQALNFVWFYLLAELAHDLPFVHLESTRECEIPVCG